MGIGITVAEDLYSILILPLHQINAISAVVVVYSANELHSDSLYCTS